MIVEKIILPHSLTDRLSNRQTNKANYRVASLLKTIADKDFILPVKVVVKKRKLIGR